MKADVVQGVGIFLNSTNHFISFVRPICKDSITVNVIANSSVSTVYHCVVHPSEKDSQPLLNLQDFADDPVLYKTFFKFHLFHDDAFINTLVNLLLQEAFKLMYITV